MSIGTNKKAIGLIKDELGGKIAAGYFGLRAKTYSCLMDDGSEINKSKGTNKCVIKKKEIGTIFVKIAY